MIYTSPKTSSAQLAWAEPLILQIMADAGKPLSSSEINARSPELQGANRYLVGRLIGGMVARGVVVSSDTKPAYYSLPHQKRNDKPLRTWHDRPAWQPCRAMQYAIERMGGLRSKITLSGKAGPQGLEG